MKIVNNDELLTEVIKYQETQTSSTALRLMVDSLVKYVGELLELEDKPYYEQGVQRAIEHILNKSALNFNPKLST